MTAEPTPTVSRAPQRERYIALLELEAAHRKYAGLLPDGGDPIADLGTLWELESVYQDEDLLATVAEAMVRLFADDAIPTFELGETSYDSFTEDLWEALGARGLVKGA